MLIFNNLEDDLTTKTNYDKLIAGGNGGRGSGVEVSV